MREIKFRAFKIGSQGWVYGYLCVDDKFTWIRQKGSDPVIININTIGQFTGLEDKDGKEIYEGDIIRTKEGNFEVCFLEYCWYLRRVFNTGISFGRLNEVWTEAVKKGLPFEVISNICENPELFEKKKEKSAINN